MDVGVRELKKNLAVIGPLPDRLRLDDGIAEGWITPPTKPVAKSVRRARSNRSVAEAMAEDRDA